MKRIFFLTIVFALFLISALDASAQTEISIYPQPDSPLQFSNVVPKRRIMTDNQGRDWNMLSAEFISQNVSGKSIRAYAIRQFEGEFSKDLGSTIFSYSATGLFKPYDLRNEGIGESSFSETSKSIKIAVDFVEFADGSVWGADISKSAQMLAGLRAGAEASLEFLKNINKQSGFETVVKSLNEIKVVPPENQSPQWSRGFGSGTSVIKNRIKNIYEKQGSKAAETELQKPFDPSSNN